MRDDTRTWFELQDALRKGLDAFLNGASLTRFSYLLYPWLDRLEAEFWLTWQDQTRILAGHKHADNINLPVVARPASTVEPESVARQLARLSAWLDEHAPTHLEAQCPARSVPCLKQFERAEYERGGAYLEPLLALHDFVVANTANLVVGVYLHGSMSTLDYVAGSSDLDALVVVKQATVGAADELLALRRQLQHTLRWFYRVDYSQHHGYAVLSELDLRFYSESFFPSTLFPYLTPLAGPSSLTIRPCREQRDPTAACRRTAAYVRKMSAPTQKLAGWFALKFYLQSVLLLPTLYLQAQGVHVYKRDAFDLARPNFSAEAWRIVEKASQVRSLSLQNALLTPGLDDRLARMPSPWLTSLVHRKLCNRVPEQVHAVLGDTWRSEAVRFVDEIESRLNGEKQTV
jgi:hypothetical protein